MFETFSKSAIRVVATFNSKQSTESKFANMNIWISSFYLPEISPPFFKLKRNPAHTYR